MIQAAAKEEAPAAAEDEIITIEHGDDGTKVEISDPSTGELVALGLIVTGVVAVVIAKLRKRKAGGTT